MATKSKIERTIIEPATPEEVEAARKQAKINAGEVPVVEPPVKEEPVEIEEEPKKEPKKAGSFVIFKSIDDKKIQLGIGKEFFEGTTITVPAELADEAERILTEGHYLITRIN